MLNFLAKVKDNALHPSGAMPTRAPKAVLGAIAVLVAGVLMFCGKSTSSHKAAPQDLRLGLTPADDARIKQLREQLDRTDRQLKAAVFLNQQRQPDIDPGYDRSISSATPAPVPSVDRALEREARERQERRASNVVFSNRKLAAVTEPSGPTPAQAAPTSQSEIIPSSAGSNKHTLYEGTLIEASLTNRLDGSFTGPVNCIVSIPVFSADRQDVLIPEGARLLGTAQRVSAFGQERLAISFHRLLMPNGQSITLSDEIGLNAIGEAGLKDKTDHHLFRLIATSAAVGVLGGVAIAGTTYGAYTTGDDRVLQSTVGSATASVTRILDRFLNVLPTVTIREGHRVRVYLSRDISLSAYKEAI